MSASSVAVRGLSHRFGSRPALVDVSIVLHGGITALLGPNGAGKTTLLRTLATTLRLSEGSVHVDGLDAGSVQPRTEIRRRLGFLPQEVAFPSRATVFDVLDVMAVHKELGDARARRGEVARVAELAGVSSEMRTRAGALSVGMGRRLGIAQALLGSPRLLLLDEPMAGLDPEARMSLRGVLAELGRTTTIALSTHLVDEAAALADRLVVLRDGRIVFDGSPSQLAARGGGEHPSAERGYLALGGEWPPSVPPPG